MALTPTSFPSSFMTTDNIFHLFQYYFLQPKKKKPTESKIFYHVDVAKIKDDEEYLPL